MKYRVKLRTTVTAWVEVEVTPEPGMQVDDLRIWAAEDAVDIHSGQFREFLAMAQEHAPGGMDVGHGPIELAHEELDESVQVVA